MKIRFSFLQACLFFPFLGVFFFIAQSEYQARTGTAYRVNIRGYDPRDLLHGHYLLYQFDLSGAISTTQYASIYCFQKQHAEDAAKGYTLTLVSHTEAEQCTSNIRKYKLAGSHKYFIPQAKAYFLEKALRTESASVDLIINKNQSFSIGQLYLNDQPWQEFEEKSKAASATP